jgi:hypothetical protein
MTSVGVPLSLPARKMSDEASQHQGHLAKMQARSIS